MSKATTSIKTPIPATDSTHTPWSRGDLIGLAGAVCLFLVVSVLTINLGSPLGHDEALYATRAREFLNGDPAASWYSGNRAPGLPLLLTLAWLGNATEPYLRFVVTSSGVVLIVLTWMIGRMMIGRTAALIAAYGVALTPIIIISATMVWPDVPAAAAGLGAMFVYGWGLSGRRFEWWKVLLVVVLVVVSTVIRFGAPLSLAVGFIGLTIWRWPKETDRKARVLVVALAGAALVALILMTPVVTGGGIPGRTISVGSENNPAFQGFLDYWSLWDRLAAGSVAVGLLGLVSGLVGSFFDKDLRRVFLWPFLIALGTFVVVASVVHGETRYLTPFYPWFWLAAAAGLAAIAERLPASVNWVAGVALVVACTAVAPGLSNDAQEFNMGFTTIETAARTLSDDGPCGVFTSYAPQVEWYSGCETAVINRRELVVDSPRLPDGPRYLFMVQNGKRQPDGMLLDLYLAKTTGSPAAFGPPGRSLRFVEIWELED